MHANDLPSPAPSLGGRLAVWLATGVGIGMASPVAPGTIGGLWGLALVSLIDKLPRLDVQLAVIAILLVAATLVCGVAARAMGARDDPQAVVLDEIVVLPLVFLGASPLSAPVLVAGFLLFRLFDIWKPGLVREFERLPGGWGIVADDVAAAFLAWAALRAAVWLDGAMNLHGLVAA